MNCLNQCENDVLNFCLSQGEAAFGIYQCAEHLAKDYKVGEVADAVHTLQHIGLLCGCGQDGIVSISPALIGDVAKGAFRDGSHASEELLDLQRRLLEVEEKHEKAVMAAGGRGKGGLARDKN